MPKRRRGSPVPVALAVLETAKVSVPTLVEGLLGVAQRQRIDRRIDDWSRRALAHAATELRVEGREHIPPGETFVVMSNHQSNTDIFVIFRAFPGTLRMVAKAEMRHLPLLGPAMNAAEFIFVDRRNRDRAREAMAQAADTIRSGVNVWIAPEGTRNATLGTFKKGGFMLALETGARILPCTLNGTHEVMPKGSAFMRRNCEVTVRFHPPIDPQTFGYDRRDALVQEVRDAIASGLPGR